MVQYDPKLSILTLYDSMGKAFERTLADFLPYLPLKSGENLADYIIRSLGILSFALVLIPLRRKLERKFRE
jgi:hypothetical protein